MAGGKKKSNILILAAMGVLVFALGGFGIGNFGGSVRSIGAVGETEIPVTEYGLALQNALRARLAEAGEAPPLSSAAGEALAEGVRRAMFAAAALENETARLGLSVGDEAVRRTVLAQDAFRDINGNFDRAAYADALDRIGLSEDDFEESLRSEAASALTRAAVVSGLPAPETALDAIARYAGERRDALWLKLGPDALDEPLPEPDDAALQAQYEAAPEAYTLPERRRVTYAALTPEMLVGSIEVEEAALQDLYDRRADEFNRPERRLVERLVFPDDAAADAAKAALDAGSATFEFLVTGRGLTLADVDLGDVSQADLDEAGAEVFALDAPGIVGPLQTGLGPALFRVNAILPAEVTPLDDVRDMLTDELALDRARRQIGDQREPINDLLAGGATLEELADETAMELGTIEVGPETADGMAAYPAFREAVSSLSAGDFPELIELEDGSLVAMRLEEILEPTLQTLEDVRDQVAEDWRRAETERRLADLADRIRAARTAGASFEAQGYTPEKREGLARDSFVDGAPDALVEAVFALEPGATQTIAGGDGTVHVIELVSVTEEDAADPEAQAVRAAIGQTLRQTIEDDVESLFVRMLQNESGISLNQAAISAVHAQFP